MSVPVLVISTVLVARFIWRKWRSPTRPVLTVILDTLFDLPALLKISFWSRPFSLSYAVTEAIKETNLTEFGFNEDGDFIKRYELTRKYGLDKSGAVISPAGHALGQHAFLKKMKERLFFVDFLRRHPSIQEVKLKAPIFVIGLTRTGTTFLHERLGLHEQVRSHYTWEQLAPVPSTHDESITVQDADRQRRYKGNKQTFNFLFRFIIGEKIQHIHRIGYDEPEECTVPCSFSMPWALSELPWHIISAAETLPLGAGKTFELYRAFLQLLTWQAKERRDQDFTWMLKCPFHLPYLEELAVSFPGCTIVWTHRDPAQCIASACSLFQTLMQFACEDYSVDPVLMGRAVMQYSRLCLDKAEASLEVLQKKGIKVVHVRYADNLKKPKEVCREVLEQANIAYTAQYDAKLDEYLKKNAEEREKMKAAGGKAEVHEYKPEDYGLTAEKIRAEFKDYVEKYKL
ncbi:sulfotransferase [archaeon]|nr:MAG: sulfotransferase [archaeon]